jgi:general secretion pathway protein F
MPAFEYKGLTAQGKATRGVIDAESARVARSKLRSEGVFPTAISESQAAGGTRAPAASTHGKKKGQVRSRQLFVGRIPPLELSLATRQLSTLVGAAVPLVESLTALTEQIEHPRLKTVMARVRDRVNEGANFADALQEAEVFPSLYVSLVRAGEASGALEHVLSRLAEYLESQVRLQNKVGSIMIYPLIMMGVALVVVSLLVTVVLPQITDLLVSMDMELPIYTRIIIGGSNFMLEWWWALLIAGVGGFFGLRAYVGTEKGRRNYDKLRLRLPIFGRLVRLIAISRFTSTLSTLLSGGVPIVNALGISKHVADNVIIGESIDNAREAIIEGASLARPLKESGHFPPVVIHMIQVGERSGELESMLEKVAENFDEQIETTVTRLSAMMEPVLILVMVVIVMIIILATLVPLLELTSGLG